MIPRNVGIIKHSEGLRLVAYLCPASVWTIGYGHTMNVKQGDKITKRQADVLLREDLEMFSAQLHRVIKVPVTQNQYDALLSLCYNIGIGNFKKSTLLKLLNASDYNGAANEFSKWRKAKGKILNGLVTRRKLERKLFLKEEI